MARSEPSRLRRSLDGWVEPIDAYTRLRAAGHDPLLLDGLGDHPAARYAYLALRPIKHIVYDGTLRVDDGDGAVTLPGAPLHALRRLLAQHAWPMDEPEGFTGGWVGFFGYEAQHLFEPTLPRVHHASTPDVWLRLCTDMLVFDRRDRCMVLYCHDLEGTGRDQRADAVTRDLAAGGEAPDVPPLDPTWQPSLDEVTFQAAVGRLRERIRTGDLFQANLATRFQAKLQVDPAALYAAMARHNPSPFMALIEADDFAIVSNSPEQLFAVQDGRISSRPIAGTRPRGATAADDAALDEELRSDEKERAEHTMLVDLVRNDVARVSAPGTVHVPELMSVERYRRVMHLVSRVDGQVAPGTDFLDWMAALFPGGTITGAPKHRACMRIAEEETVARGPYTGSAGFLSWSGNAHWNIMIRTLVQQGASASVHAGSGVVMDSDAAKEWQEAGHKAAALLEAASGSATGGSCEVTRYDAWRPPSPAAALDARVLLIDNYDSFVHNLADYCAASGATVRLLRNDADWRAELEAFDPTHIILSPGPGHPADAGASMEIARTPPPGVAILGVCLGHQCLALATGAKIEVVPAVHGKTAVVEHDGSGLFAGLGAPLQATRYHSLAVDRTTLGDDWEVTAWLPDGLCMAMQHRDEPWTGLQFHPESIGTPDGLAMVAAWLADNPFARVGDATA